MPTIFGDKVEINELVFNDSAQKPVGAVQWGCDVIDGWHSTPQIDVVTAPESGGLDGDIIADPLSSRARYLLIGGWAHGVDRQQTELLQDIIMRDVVPVNQDIKLARYEFTPKYLSVRVVGQCTIIPTGPTHFRWTANVAAGDPYKYDLEPPATSYGSSGVAGQSTGGRTYPRTYPRTYSTITSGEENSVTITNRGSARTYPIVTITGPLNKGAWRLSNDTTGNDIRFDIALSLNDVLVIDFRKEVALLNGYPVTSSIFGDFWPVEPGVNVIKLYADYDPAASVSVVIESAWR